MLQLLLSEEEEEVNSKFCIGEKEVGVKSVNTLAESTAQTLVLLIVADLKIGIYFARLLGDVQWSFLFLATGSFFLSHQATKAANYFCFHSFRISVLSPAD